MVQAGKPTLWVSAIPSDLYELTLSTLLLWIPNSVRFRQVVTGTVKIQINKNKFIVLLSDKHYHKK